MAASVAQFLTNRILYWALVAKVQVFFEGQKNLKESPTLRSNLIQENMGYFFKVCGLLRISELYNSLGLTRRLAQLGLFGHGHLARLA